MHSAPNKSLASRPMLIFVQFRLEEVLVSESVQVDYDEIIGAGDAGPPASMARDLVVLSSVERGSSWSEKAPALTVRYLARGREEYRIGHRFCRLEAGQVMIAPQQLGSECKISGGRDMPTLGLYALLSGSAQEEQWLDGPLVIHAGCTPLGAVMAKTAGRLWDRRGNPRALATALVASLRHEMTSVRNGILAKAAAIDAEKPSTRFEMLRKASLAQAYLHSTLDRAVALQELAEVAAVSPIAVLRAFQGCFGESPSVYHRKIRLRKAIAEAEARGVSVGLIASDYGFAGASGFSHAYRRTLGRSRRSEVKARQ